MRLRIAATARARLRGLLFRAPSWLGQGGVLLLVPCRSVHTFFMRRELDIAFVDGEGRVVASERSVPPNRVRSASGAVAVLERFACPSRPWPQRGEALLLADSCQAPRHSVYLLGRLSEREDEGA